MCSRASTPVEHDTLSPKPLTRAENESPSSEFFEPQNSNIMVRMIKHSENILLLKTVFPTQLPHHNFPQQQLPQLPTSPTATSTTTISPSSKITNFPNVKKSIFKFANHITRSSLSFIFLSSLAATSLACPSRSAQPPSIS